MLQVPWLVEDEKFMKTIKSDVRSIIEGPNKSDPSFYTRAALSDIILIFKMAKKAILKKKNKSSMY